MEKKHCLKCYDSAQQLLIKKLRCHSWYQYLADSVENITNKINNIPQYHWALYFKTKFHMTQSLELLNFPESCTLTNPQILTLKQCHIVQKQALTIHLMLSK